MTSANHVAFLGECMLELQGTAFGQMRQNYGGDTFNTAIYLSRCAGKSVRTWYATAVGDDTLSDELLKRWDADGLELDLIRKIQGKLPGIYQIEVDPLGERRFSFWRDASAARHYFDIETTPLEERASEWNAFYFSGISLAILPQTSRQRVIDLARQVRANGAMVVFDNNYRPRLWQQSSLARESFSQAFAVATTALVTLDDHQALFGTSNIECVLDQLRDFHCPEIVIKRGPQPTLIKVGLEAVIEIATSPVTKVVDTTAAGDSFAAGYLCHRLEGQSPATAAEFGNTLAARVIQYSGALIPLEAMSDLMPR